MKRLLLALTCISALTACASFDQEKAAERRLDELCTEIATQHLSHCAGNHIPPPPLHPDANPQPSKN